MSEEATVAEQEAPTTTEPQAVEQVQERFDSARVREATPPPDFVPPSEDGEMHDMMVKRLYEDMGVIVEDEKAKDEPAPEPEVKEEPEVKDEQPSSPEVEEP